MEMLQIKLPFCAIRLNHTFIYKIFRAHSDVVIVTKADMIWLALGIHCVALLPKSFSRTVLLTRDSDVFPVDIRNSLHQSFCLFSGRWHISHYRDQVST
jgi:hypothetical protein